MILFKTASGISNYLLSEKNKGKSTGFVPTMGALHEGHLRLIKHSINNCDITICSIFVNPTQFNDVNDFARYPVTTDRDLLLLEEAGCDVVFLPSVEEIYPNGIAPTRHFDLGYLENILEGKYRPGHFQGVCQVVKRLLDIVQPDTLFLGRKDYQQCMVIRRLIELESLPTTLRIVPTLRESSGLALSSRNMRLTEPGRTTATAIWHSLQYIKQNLRAGVIDPLTHHATQMLREAGFGKIDYVTLCDADSLEEVHEWNGEQKLVALVAAFLEGVRLIDNMEMNG